MALFPVQTIVVGIIIAIAYVTIRNANAPLENINVFSDRESRRRQALASAGLYLAPYNNIWGNLKLSNTHCSLRLQSNGRTIVGKETVYPYRSFRVTHSQIHSHEDLWNMFCNVFDHNTHFDSLVELCNTFRAVIKMDKTVQSTNINSALNNNQEVKIDVPVIKQEKKEKLDVNNASEVELTALPGISIVLSKKIIKRREEIGGFKDVTDFLAFTQLKPHMRQQLKELICVNKMKGSVKIKRNSERSVDL